jgi:[FeFe] hydrogenase H-cluster maturation GTPase HydF
MNETHSSERVHIAFFGKRNAGKSSLVNAVTGQNIALVSGIKGTTTDPVYKSMELLPLGPVMIIDTPGFDDEGELGELRVQKARQVLNKTDAAVLVSDELLADTLSAAEEELVNIFRKKNIPYIIAYNKCDLHDDNNPSRLRTFSDGASAEEIFIPVSAKTGFNINLLKEKIAAIALNDEPKQPLIADLIKPLDIVVLVIPIDKAAPKGRIILAQQQMLRSILDAGGITAVVRESELEELLASLGKKPVLVITDSQAFAKVSAVVPLDIPLTSFSILFARYKGWLESAVNGISALDSLQDNDKVLICEGCTHHRQCDDIGTVKLPRMIRNYTEKEPQFVFFSGGDFPQELSGYKMVIHCGACMLNEREMQYRRLCAEDQNVPLTNYGITIAFVQGILKRSISMLLK